MMNFSASQLVKKSAAQMVYLIKRNQKEKVTKKQLRGNDYAEKENKGLPQEMRGTVIKDEFRLFFCIDAVDGRTAIETKMVEGDYQDWYLNSSILQSAFYFQLLSKVKYLDTPAFRKKEGYEDVFYDLIENPINRFELRFGDLRNFEIKYNNKKLMKHFFKKAELVKSCVDLDWDEAMYISKKWDAGFKFKEFDIFKNSFQFKEL